MTIAWSPCVAEVKSVSHVSQAIVLQLSDPPEVTAQSTMVFVASTTGLIESPQTINIVTEKSTKSRLGEAMRRMRERNVSRKELTAKFAHTIANDIDGFPD